MPQEVLGWVSERKISGLSPSVSSWPLLFPSPLGPQQQQQQQGSWCPHCPLVQHVLGTRVGDAHHAVPGAGAGGLQEAELGWGWLQMMCPLPLRMLGWGAVLLPTSHGYRF